MANTFTRHVNTNVGMTSVTMYTVAASTTTVIMGCHVANLTSSAITVTLKAAGATIAKDVSIPANSALDVVNSSKINLVATYTVTLVSSAPVSADAILSIMERT